MEQRYCKGEARRERYKARTRKARGQARFVMFLLLIAGGASVWMDERLGKGARAYAATQLEWFEDATKDSQGKANVVVAMMISKINPN